jgi:hypothetical protein
MLRNNLLKQIAKAALEAAIGGPLAKIAGVLSDAAFDSALSGSAAGIEAMVEEIVQDLDRACAGNVDLQPIQATVTGLLSRHAPPPERIIDARFDPERIAVQIMSDGHALLHGLSPGERGLVQRLLAAVYRSLLDRQDELGGLRTHFRREVLRQFDLVSRQLTILGGAVQEIPTELAKAGQARLLAEVLELPRGRFATGLMSTDVLLGASYRIVPYLDHNGQLAELLSWCDRGSDVLIRLYAGRGGLGKTRLLLEACEALRDRGWFAGFASTAGELAPKSAFEALVEADAPTLAGMDYAETRASLIEGLLESLARRATTFRQPKRLVLIARRSGDWWLRLQRTASDQARSLLRGPAASGAAHHLDILKPENRTAMYEAAIGAFAAVLGRPHPRTAAPDLSGATYATPLLVQIRALAAVEGEAVVDAESPLLVWILDRQRRLWKRAVNGDDFLADAVAQAAALVYQVKGCVDDQHARQLLAAVPKLQGASPRDKELVLHALRVQHPGELFLNPIAPDLVGERLLAEEDRAFQG